VLNILKKSHSMMIVKLPIVIKKFSMQIALHRKRGLNDLQFLLVTIKFSYASLLLHFKTFKRTVLIPYNFVYRIMDI